MSHTVAIPAPDAWINANELVSVVVTSSMVESRHGEMQCGILRSEQSFERALPQTLLSVAENGADGVLPARPGDVPHGAILGEGREVGRMLGLGRRPRAEGAWGIPSRRQERTGTPLDLGADERTRSGRLGHGSLRVRHGLLCQPFTRSPRDDQRERSEGHRPLSDARSEGRVQVRPPALWGQPSRHRARVKGWAH